MIILDSEVGNYVTSGGKKFSYFAGNNYLGLANHPLIKEASIRSIEKYGLNFSASRQTTGTSGIHLELEKQLSSFKKKQDSVIFASGYMGNKILLRILREEYSALFIDKCAHASITDGIPHDVSRVCFYDHCSTEHLESLLKRTKKYKPLIITDGLFSLTGEIAPLADIMHLAEEYDAIVIVDDAHSTGILGKNGRGTVEYFFLESKENLYQTETMSKALGAYGGFIAGSKELINSIRDRSTIYQASTSLPPPLVSAGIACLKIMEEHPGLRKRVLDIGRQIKTEISGLGYKTTPDDTPIIPVFFRSYENAGRLSAFLMKNDIIVPFVNYPVNIERFVVRITASASHTDEQVDELLNVFKKWRNKYGTDNN